MDYKEQLISMIKAAANLPKSELEQVPGTDLWVKKGEVAKLFSSVKEDIKDESEEYYNAKAYEIYKANEDNIAKFERFNKNLDSINANYEKLSKQLAKLQGKVDAVDKEKLDKIMHDIREYAENRDILTNTIIDLVKNEINANFVKAINEQMEDIRNSFLTSPRGTEIGYGDNGLSILASDKPEYDSLIGLLRLMNTIDTNEKIVSVDGVMCVNSSQVEEAKKLLSKIKAFKRLKTESKEDRMEKANQKLIDEIVAELRNIESKVKESKVAAIYPMDNGVMMTPAYKDQYKDLLKILKYLNEANDKKFALTSIWDGIAFVNGPDRTAFIELISRTEPINDHNPNNLKRENNNKLIAELEEYLKSMENDFNTYNGVTNIASAVTKNNTIVLDDAVNEYNYIYDIIEILKDTEDKELYDVLGIASVSYDNITRFESLVSKTKKFGKMIPEIEENKAEIEKIKERLIELNNLAKEKVKIDPSAKLAPSGDVLEEDFEEYQILIDKLRYLETSKGKKGLEDVDGVKILPGYAPEYQNLNKRLKELANRKVYQKNNIKKIEELEAEINHLSSLETDSIIEAKIKALQEMIETLTIQDWSSESLIVEGSLMVNDLDKYKIALERLDNLAVRENLRNNNVKEIRELEEKINILVQNAQNSPSADKETINGLTVLSSDTEKLKSLLDMKDALIINDWANDDAPTNGTIAVNDKDKYMNALETLNKIEKNKNQSNNKKIEEINKRIEQSKANPEESPIKLEALETIKNCLENAMTSNNLVEFEGVKIDADDYARYIEAIAVIAKNELEQKMAKDEEAFKKLREDLKNKKGKNPESKKERHKISLRKLKDKVKFKRKRKETISEGIIKTIGNRVKSGVMHPVRTIKGIRDNIKGLGKTAKESYQNAREKVKNAAEERRNARKNKNIQEQVAEELKTEEREEQQTTAQIGENVQAQILENSKKRLLEIVAEQNGLEENSPEYQALDKEAQDLGLKIAELEGIDPSMEIDFGAADEVIGNSTGSAGGSSVSTTPDKSVPIPPVTNIAPDTVAPPVVAVPSTSDILNTLGGAAESTSSSFENSVDVSTLEALRDQYQLEREAIGNPMDLQAISLETKINDLNDQINSLKGGSRK